MTDWLEKHSESERLAAEAELLLRRGAAVDAQCLYAQAAQAETQACEVLDRSKTRTLGVSVVSAVALWYKANDFERAERVACEWLATGCLPQFAVNDTRSLIQSIWNQTARDKAQAQFLPGQILVSVKGGEVVPGGAPLDLVVEKVQTLQSLFYRTAELLSGVEYRKRGVPGDEIREGCRPWLFQALAGSYQFAVAIQESRQRKLPFEPKPAAREIADRVFQILRASVEEPESALPAIVSDKEYRGTFLKLARNLAPTGVLFDEMQVRSSPESHPITLEPCVRKSISEAIRREHPPTKRGEDSREESLRGILRAVHLDQDWLEVTVGGEHKRVTDVGDTVDDVIGPMVNRPVIVHVLVDARGKCVFRDIEPDE